MASVAAWQAGAAPSGVLSREALLGRDSDADELRARCKDARLVTLLGPGGAGKTSLAAVVAPEVAGDLGTTPWWVDLQPVDDGDRIAAAIGDALGITVAGGGAAATMQLAVTLGDRELLLVLDNCEHLAEDVALALDVLLPRCRGLRLLTTSREVIGVTSEHVVRLPPLALPPIEALASPDVLRSHAATALFLDRASLDATELDDETRAAVASICRHVDGLPLAIELAAARSPALSPVGIDAALEDRFRLLTSRRRTVADRQRTLEASIGWSYGLLGGEEQQLLRALAVFPTGFDLTAAASVGAEGDEPSTLDLLAGLIDKSLVAVQERASGRRYRLLESVRAFGEQELTRNDELDAARERHLEATRQRLARLQLSDEHEGLVLRGESWLAEEFDDVRAAAAWAAATDRPEAVIDLWWAVHVWANAHYRPNPPFMGALAVAPEDLDELHRVRRDTMLTHGPRQAAVRGDTQIGARVVASLWDGDTADPDRPLTAFFARLWLTAVRAWSYTDDHEMMAADARLLAGIARARHEDWGDLPMVATAVAASRPLAYISHPDESLALAVDGVTAAERIGSSFLVSVCHLRAAAGAARMGLAAPSVDHIDRAYAAVPAGWDHLSAWMATTVGHLVALATGEIERTERAFEQYGGRAGAEGSPTRTGMGTVGASLLLHRGRHDEALQQARTTAEAAEAAGMMVFAFGARTEETLALVALGEVDEAQAVARRARAAVTPGVDTFLQTYLAHALSEALLAADDPAGAMDVALEAVQLAIQRLHLLVLPMLAVQIATAMLAQGRTEDAARTLGVLDGELDARGATMWPRHLEQRRTALAACQDRLGDDAAAALDAGSQLTWNDWAAWLARGPGSRSAEAGAVGWPSLTDTEVDVARRAAEGLSNAELADVMFVSVNTIKTHIRHVYEKLDVHSRVELAQVVDQHT